MLALRLALLRGLLVLRKPVRADLAKRHHQMSMIVPPVAVAVRPMDCDIDRVSLPHKLLARKILHQPFALLIGQFMR